MSASEAVSLYKNSGHEVAVHGAKHLSLALGADDNWRKGYVIVGLIQLGIALIAVLSLPLWKKAEKKDESNNPTPPKTLTLFQLLRMPAVRMSCFAFFIYRALLL